jgi:hypothetical protein
MMMHSSALAAYAQYTLAESFIPELPDRYRGKVRENYDLRENWDCSRINDVCYPSN